MALAFDAAAVAAGTSRSLASILPAMHPLPALQSWLQLIAITILAAGSLLSLWRYGLAAWLEPLFSDTAGHHHYQHEEAEP